MRKVEVRGRAVDRWSVSRIQAPGNRKNQTGESRGRFKGGGIRRDAADCTVTGCLIWNTTEGKIEKIIGRKVEPRGS